jgi:hypothetical protein
MVSIGCQPIGKLQVTYLGGSDASGFDRMMNAILAGRPFAEAVTIGYHDDVRSLWKRFVSDQ